MHTMLSFNAEDVNGMMLFVGTILGTRSIRDSLSMSVWSIRNILGGAATPIGIHGEAGLAAAVYGVISAGTSLDSPSLGGDGWTNG
ncbi:hypothetical protein HK100_006653 [Physocladia obscura]|uniref:Uncharacterized protein n=1 Tax=Physocladia obscura TaxID=109957 RepID=A0AAD5SSB3_9FUNG|nr:hypothetical protein HK100_006653 [Physocladia obscura]